MRRARHGVRTAAASLTLVMTMAGACAVSGCGDGDGDGSELLHVPELSLRAGPEAEADAMLRKATRLLGADARSEAEPLLLRVLELDPESDRARGLLAELLTDQRRRAEAIPLLRAMLEDVPKDLRAHRLLAESLHVTGDLAGADEAYRAWIKADRESDEALFGWGQLLYERAEFKAALKAFGKAEKRRPARADVRSEMGLTLQALGRLAEAEAKQRDALERDPRSAEAWFRLGNLISKRGDGLSEEAIDAMRSAVRREPRHIDAQVFLYRLLRIAVREGEVELVGEANRRWRSVLRLHGRTQLGKRAGAPRRAAGGAREEQRLLAVLEESPDDLDTRRALAEWLHAAGHLDEAVDAYELVLAGAPSATGPLGGGAIDGALLRQAGAACIATGLVERGAELLARAVAAPDCPAEARRHLAWALLLLDRAQESLTVSERTLAATPDDRPARLAHGLATMRLGRLDEGLQAISAAGWLR